MWNPCGTHVVALVSYLVYIIVTNVTLNAVIRPFDDVEQNVKLVTSQRIYICGD